MAVTDQLSFLTVTYERDFDLLERLLQSIKLFFDTTYKHYIVLNDSIDHLAELEEIVGKFPMQTKIILREKFQDFQLPLVENCQFGYRFTAPDNGWLTQTMLTMLSAEEIETPFYLHLCSKDIFKSAFDISSIINDGKTVVWNENFDHGVNTNQFIEFAVNACNFFNLDFNQYKHLLIRPATPVVVNTQQMKNMLIDLKSQNVSVIDLIGLNESWRPSQGKTNEYYLYSAWLAKNNYINESLVWHTSKSHNIYNTIRSYDLRRTN
jgi:hypothetical protein